MKLTFARPGRKMTTVATLVVAASLLAGCSTLTYEEAQASEHRVVESGKEFLEGRSWTYINPAGNEIPLTEDCKDGFFEQRCFGSPDGSVEFRFSRSKQGAFVRESITINGQQFDADCRSEAWQNVYTCAPLPTD